MRGTPVLTLLPGYRDSRFVLSPFLVFGPRIDWQIPGRAHPDLAYFNYQGFRTTDAVGPKAEGEFRIIAVGGSTTENVWNDLGIHWPLVLECEIQRNGYPQTRVLNAGMSAYSSAHSLIRLAFDLLDYEPDLILVMHNVNDLGVTYMAAEKEVAVDPHYHVKYGEKSYTYDLDASDVVLSRIFHMVRSRWRGRALKPAAEDWSDYSTEEGERIFSRNLDSLVSLTRSRGGDVMLLTMPYSPSFGGRPPERRIDLGMVTMPVRPSDQSFFRDLGRFNDVVRNVAIAREVQLADMEREFGSDEGNFVDAVHYTNEGIHRFGRTLAPFVLGYLHAKGVTRTQVDPDAERCEW